MADNTNIRLDRIEEKLDRLTDVMINMASFEEKLAGLKEDHDRGFERMNRLSVKIDDIQKKVDENAHTVSIINKLVYAAVVAAVGTFVAQMWI
jgi:hypothetical protein